MTFEDLYAGLLEESVSGKENGCRTMGDPYHLDCLYHPGHYAPIIRTEVCRCSDSEPPHCAAACLFDAISRDDFGNLFIDPDKCSGCSACVEACHSGVLTASRDVLPALEAIKKSKGPVFALVAPAFMGQFPDSVTPGKLRSAFRAIGFDGMVEVALFADILTLKEALAFHQHIHSEKDFQLTSCCCPVWIAMIRKQYAQFLPHVPGAVSPMIAAGRTVKYLCPDALTVFISPCAAKKAESREKDLRGAVDYVLTFQEIQDIFNAAAIRPEELADIEKNHSSGSGRIYARKGGVSEAVCLTAEKLIPEPSFSVRPKTADGVTACKKMVNDLVNGVSDGNFFEGMGCIGGCVGGPKVFCDPATGKRRIDRYGREARCRTPLENPYVPELLERLGFESVEDFLANSDMFNRDFSS